MSPTLRGLTLLALFAWLAFPPAACAHRLDEYLQATLVVIDPDGIRLQINLTPGVAVAEQVLALIDRDHNGVISTNEAAIYADLVRSELTLQLDQRPQKLNFASSDFPPADELRTGLGIIRLEYAVAPGPFPNGAHELAFENRHQTNLSVYLVNAALPKSSAIRIMRQTRSDNQSTARIEFTFQPPPADRSGAKRLVLPLGIALVVVCVGAVIRWRRMRGSAT